MAKKNITEEYELPAVPKENLATFVIHMQYCKNGSWQGKLIWTDEKKETNFRSALELIKLMDGALSESEN